MASTLDQAIAYLARAVALLDGVQDDVRAARIVLAQLGWDLPEGVDDIGLSRLDVREVGAQSRALTELLSTGTATDLEVAAAVGELVIAVSNALELLATAAGDFDAPPAYMSSTNLAKDFFPRLADLLVIQAVGASVPAALPIGVLLGIFELTLAPADPTIFQVEHVRQVVRWDRMSQALTDPAGLFVDVYGWGTADFDGNTLVANLSAVLETLAVDTRLRSLPRRAEEQLSGRAVPEADATPAIQLVLSLAKGLGVDAHDVGVSLFPMRPSAPGGTDGGLGLSPYVVGTADKQFPIAEHLALVVESSVELAGGIALLLRAGSPPELKTGLVVPGTGDAGAEVTVAVRRTTADDERLLLLDAPGIALEADAIMAGGGLGVGSTLDPTAMIAIEGGHLLVAPDRSDGFLASVLPADGVSTAVDIKISWSNANGLRIEGGVGLRTTLTVDSAIGPLHIDSVELALVPTDRGISLTATVSGAVTLGPFVATIDGIGAAAELRFERGNLGPVDVHFGFVPPTGLGLSIDAPPVTGGGSIKYDPATHRYSGTLQLRLGTISLTGVGLLDARLPGGADGFALLISMRATFPPIQVGFGFALTGIGGLVALNRRVDVDALRHRLASGTAGRILAPEDPVQNAPALLADLDSVFPVAPGVAVVGPTVQLVWAELVRFDVGVFIEFPGPERVVILGSARASIDKPDGGRPYLVIRLDVVGVIDLAARTAAFDAVLIDSQLLEVLDLTGGAAFRLSWGDSPYAVLTIGGFHPGYNPEPLVFPRGLTRVAMVRGKPSDRLYLRFEGYFAITSNTLQLGARVEAIINVGNFSIKGTLEFDALIQFQPFYFQFDIRASVHVRYKSRNLAGLTLTGSLSGPGPVTLRAKVCIELLFFDICFEETLTLGSSTPPTVTPVPSAVAALTAELDQPANLRASETLDRYVALRPPPTSGAPVVSPLGQLVWTQQRAPLDLLLQRIGGAPLDEAELVHAASPEFAGSALDWFAPGAFADLSGSEALNRRAFERLAGGLRLGREGTDDGPAKTKDVTVHQIRLPARATSDLRATSFPVWLTEAAAARLGLIVNPLATPVMGVHDEQWVVADATGGVVADHLSQAQAHQLVALGGPSVAAATTDLFPSFQF